MDTMLYLRMSENFDKAHPFNEKVGVRKMVSYAKTYPFNKVRGFSCKNAVKAACDIAKVAAAQVKKAHTMKVLTYIYTKQWTAPTEICGMSAKEWYDKNEKMIHEFCKGKAGYYYLPTTKVVGWKSEYYWFCVNIYYYLHTAWYMEQKEIRDKLWNDYLSDMRAKNEKAKKAYMERISKMSPEELMWESVRAAF